MLARNDLGCQRLLVRQTPELSMAVDSERDEDQREEGRASDEEHPSLSLGHTVSTWRRRRALRLIDSGEVVAGRRSDVNTREVAHANPRRVDQCSEHDDENDHTENPGQS
jgi:hypothetical protein